ncbi:MAG TPA: nucleotidyltransferase substrate binding protein [Flavobacterium sp.]|jgi:nucleotidyltransferase substrate binding protein (TIGR01987 family)
MEADIRWQQRFNSYQRALLQLNGALELAGQKSLSPLEKQGMIQAFETTHELSWKVMQDYLKQKGNNDIYGSKDASRAAFRLGLVDDGDVWMDMIVSRNLSSHTYDEKIADAIFDKIINNYSIELNRFEKKMVEIKMKEGNPE